MAKVSPIQQAFNAGELTPLLGGRPEIAKYGSGLEVCLNYIPLVQGPIVRRQGTIFSAEVKDSSKETRLVRFEFSITQAYRIEFGDLYCRFFKDNVIVTEAAVNITGATQANPVVLTAVAHGFSDGDRVTSVGVGGMTQLNNREFTVANKTADTFELQSVDGTGYDAYTSGGTVAKIYEIVSPYLEADLFQLKFTQSNDVSYITHPSYEPRKLSRTADTSWTLSIIDFLDGPYLPGNISATTLTPSATSGNGINITASAITGINGDAGFKSTDVGRLIRIKNGATPKWGYAKITSITSTTIVVADVKSDFGNTSGVTDWRLGVWSETTGYPGASTFFEDRLVLGGPTSYQQRLDGSRSGDYENMAPSDTDGTVADDHAISYTLNANNVNVIRWMLDDEKGLLVGTVGGEWLVRPSKQSEALSPTNVAAKRSTVRGSANIQALRVDRAAIFVQRAGRKIRELAYVFEVDGFRAPDMTRLSEHITRKGLKELAYQEEPQSIVWAIRNDGALLGLTYERDEDVVGWHRHILGGVFGTGNAVVESVAVIPSADGSYDEVGVIVKRTINGATKRYVEYITKFFEEGDDQKDGVFVDSGLTYDGAATLVITGLYHLEGETISLLVDGATHADKTVLNGKITLDIAGSKVHGGLGYNSDGQNMRIEAGAQDGTAQGKVKRVYRCTFRLHNSLGLKVGPSFTKLTPIIFRSSADKTAAPVPLFSGDKRVTWGGGYETEGQICWRQDAPLPSTLLAIMPQLVTQDGG